MTTFDTETLEEVIDGTYSLAGDTDCPSDQAKILNTLAKRLKASFDRLVGAEFDNATQNFTSATKALGAVNTTLSSQAQALAGIGDTVKQITDLANALDGLVKLVPGS